MHGRLTEITPQFIASVNRHAFLPDENVRCGYEEVGGSTQCQRASDSFCIFISTCEQNVASGS